MEFSFERKYNNTLICQISKNSISNHRREIKYLIKNTHRPEELITKFNSKARGWMNYHHCCNRIWDTWNHFNHYTYKRLIKWCKRRHSNKTEKWVFNQYWKRDKGKLPGTTRWVFQYKSEPKGETYKLQHYDLKQKRTGPRISKNTNIYDLKNKEKIRQVIKLKKVNLPFNKSKIWYRQKGICPSCNCFLDPQQPDNLDLHHIKHNKDGGSDNLNNLTLLHEHCHYESHHGKLAS